MLRLPLLVMEANPVHSNGRKENQTPIAASSCKTCRHARYFTYSLVENNFYSVAYSFAVFSPKGGTRVPPPFPNLVSFDVDI